MAKYSNTVEYNIKTNLDASGVAKLQTQLRQVEAELQRLQGRGVYTEGQVKKDLANINQIKNALKTAFNPSLGMLDNKAFMAGLTKGGKTLQDYAATFNAAGVKGSQAFASWYSQLGKIDTGLKQVSKTGDKIMNTFGNTVRWGLIASAFSQVMNAAHEAVQYVKDLDESLTNIMMVTDYSREAMNEYARSANDAAKALGSTTTAMTNATLVFAQQGFDLPKSQQLAQTSTQLANISQQDTATASDEITAYMNAFHLESIDEINNAMSKWAKVANISAADVEELSVASQKAASTAVTVGVNMDQLAAQIAAIETVTREAPENIGNGLKTLYARFSDISMGETLEDGVDLGKVTSTLQKVGVDVLTAEGNMRQVGDIMEDLMAVWGDLDLTQRSSVATTLAGKFQLSRFTALMNRSDLYKEYLAGSEGETGTETFDQMQQVFEDSMQGRLNKLQSTIEGIFTNAMDTDSFYGMIDAVTQLVQLFSDLTEAIGGGGAALTAFGAILTKVMSNNISRGLSNFVANRQRDAMVASNVESARLNAQQQLSGQGIQLKDADAQKVVNDTAQGAQYAHLMNQQQLDSFNQSLQQRTQILGALKAAEAEVAQATEQMAIAFNTVGVGAEAAEAGTVAFLEMLNEAGTSITQADLEAAGLKETIQSLGSAQSSLTNLASATELVIEAQQQATQAATELKQAEQQAGKSSQQYTRAQEQLEKAEKGIESAFELQQEHAAAAGEAFKKLSEDTNLSTQAQQKFAEIAKLAEVAVNGDVEDLKRFSASLKESQMDTNLFVEALTQLSQKGLMTEEMFVALTANSQRLREAFEAAGISAEVFNTQMANQQRMNGIVEVVSAVGQLAFAWQAFKSLGSLWSKEDVDTGKKIEETILNLGMNIPMVLMGVSQISKVFGGPGLANGVKQLKAINSVNRQVATGAITAAEGEAILAASTQATGVAATTAGAAFKAMLVSMGPLLAITAVIAALTAAWGAYSQSIENAKNREKEALDTAVSHAEEVKNTTASWDELYKKYEETGEVSQDLIKTGGELGDSLDIIGAKALAAAGDFDTLNQRIQDTKDQAYQETIDAANNLITGQYGKSLRGEELFNGSAVSDYNAALTAGIGAVYNDSGQLVGESNVADLLRKYQLGQDADFTDAIGQSKAALKELREEQQKLNEVEESNRDDSWKRRSDDIQTAINKLEEFRAMEDVQAAEQAMQEMYNARISMSDFQEQLDNAGNNAQDIIDVFAKDSSTSAYFNNLTSDAERYAEALKYVTNQAQRLNLITAYSEEKTKQLSEDQFSEFTNSSVTDSGYENDINQFAEANDLTQSQVTQLMIQGAIDQVNQNPELTLEEKEAILGSVDWSGSVDDILKTLAKGAADDATAALAQYSDMTDAKAEAGGDLSEDQLKEYGIDQDTVDAYDEQLQSLGALSEQREYYTDNLKAEKEALDKLKKSENASTEEIENQEKAVADAQEALDDYNGETKDLTAKMIQTQKGLEKLGKEFEDNNEILRSGEKNTLEYAEAMAETKDALGDVLNVEPGSLTNGFVEEHLDEIQRLAEGDISALDELRMAFGHDYLLNLNRTGNLTDEELQALQTQLDNLNLTDVEVGAYVDDDAFVESLNQMMMDGKLTQDQVNEYLNGIGVEPEYETIPHDTTLFSTEGMHVSGDILGIPYDFELPHFEVHGTVEVPQIKTSKSQGTGGHTGLRKTGGSTSGGLSNSYAPKSSGKGGGGGGGGKDKAEEPKDVAHKEAGEAEKDIYEKVNAELEKLKDNYSRVKKERDKAWGQKTIIQNANKELGLLQAQNKTLDKRIKISKEYQKALLGDAKLKEKYNVKNSLDEYGLTDKDLDGVVDNYSQQWDVAKKLAEKAQKEADDYFKAHGGQTGKDQYGNTVIIKDAQMLEAEANHYEELTKTAENAWEIVKQINDVTKEYEDTANKIRDDEEEQLDLLWEMDQIQIDMYERALDALDTLEEMADMMAKMKGMWSGFELDSPFRAMVEDVQEVKDLFAGDTKKEINDYYNNIYDNIAKNDRLTKKEKDEATKFFKQQQKNATSANGYNGLGFGELARESRKLAELQAMETNTAVRNLVYGPTQEGYEQWLDELEEQTKKVEEMALSAEEAWDKAQENIIDALDEEMDKLDKLYDKYDDIIDRVEREADRISLFHGDDQYADLSKLADQTGKVQLEKAKKYQQEYDYWEKKQSALKAEEERERNRRIEEAKQLLNNASTAEEIANANLVMEQAKQYHSDEWEWYDEKMQEAQENVLDAQDAAAEAFKEAYELAIDEIEAEWLESALGTRDTNYLEDDWNRDKDYMTTYKDDYERNYEIQKLNYKWQELLNDALGSSLATQRKIRNEGQAIVDQLANQTTMSEYDVKLANARLEILQKQIALENAQQNKNQMKLRRDTQGNYKYVYAADQNDVGEKQQDLLDSIYDVWEISKDQSIGSTDNYIEAVQNAGEKAKEIWNDASLTIEQKQALIAELMADTGRLLEAISEDAGDSFNGMISAVVLGSGIGLENVSEMCANVLDALLTHNEEAIEGIGVPWDQFLGDLLVPEDGKSNIPGIAEAFKNAMDDCKNANQNFLDEIQGPEGVAAVTGEEYGKAQTAIDNAKDSTNDLYNETLKLYTLFGMESKALDEAKKTMEGYKKALDAATSGSGKFAKQIQDANDSVVKAAKASGNWITAPGKVSDTASGQTDANAISVQKVNSVATSKVSNATSGGVGNNGGYSGGGGGSGGSTGHYEVWSDHGDLVASGSTRAEALANAKGWEDLGLHVKQFATGGYTGSWSNGGIDEKNGKLAILHQKELVLNAVDTKNILTAVELVRQSTDLLKNASLSDAISKSGGIVTQTRQSEAIVSQPVTISAEFPNANSVDEIREALLSLTDAASQYAYRVGGGSPSTGRFTQGTYF